MREDAGRFVKAGGHAINQDGGFQEKRIEKKSTEAKETCWELGKSS